MKPTILICGLGSIGVRHVSNLLKIGFDQLFLVTKRTDFPPNWPQFPVFDSLEKALESDSFSHAFICTPTAQHVSNLEKIVSAGILRIYLEKPVSHSWEGIEKIINTVKSDQKIVLGFDLRLDPGLLMVRKLIVSEKFGRPLSATSFVGQYLPDWRPLEDYRNGSSALKSKGGGVLLDLVHEFDYLFWLLGKARRIAGIYQNNPELGIETEDLADVLIHFESGAQATIHLDYHQRKLERFCLFTCTKGSIRWDLANRKVDWVDQYGNTGVMDFSSTERNDRFIFILKAFMEMEKNENLASFDEGLESLKMVLAAKKSSETHTFVSL